ncbi:MAG: hypothetical protein A3B89_00250 [Candidatus Buchananbacteria bacterium RIFCSPHIGHO2_02_FULL_40_13]|uniref:Rubredoxin-like domain-containing protein n=1 Tax=Candidatus Buchananbacteria bacterium RIFCSPLOWO2_01_FULL_39_33 TaxID=1797543 RepID=A0A1G1YIY5_9BACT|nr:MAG: hypothetical protein A2820_02890 [Candidatus Buchananbacteria bacterium RIFCSPHIGHO2_01_FULL_40_35]OGY49508.1 MAG: hypothetical protein A3B89_00250 [Candidatus Buchananbacteria bacterium RIFCSPHIGHO2_02_FULL_40_13]OGY51660.1 MAG: hypothetical protein A3A02_00590 [Candidatus Buchananbacteria bacterium RIFCSPLOWO2_01_FULL_39_33]
MVKNQERKELFFKQIGEKAMNSLFPMPDHFWRCQDCGHEFYTCQSNLPPNLQPHWKCSNCGSFKITGGPIIQGGPFDEESSKQY